MNHANHPLPPQTEAPHPLYPTAIWLSSGLGLIPFGYAILHPHLSIWQGWDPYFVEYYAAIILTFVAALPWGYSLTIPRCPFSIITCAYGSILTGVAWATLVFELGLWVFAIEFALALAFDYYWLRRIPRLSWFLRLRVAMSTGVIASLVWLGMA